MISKLLLQAIRRYGKPLLSVKRGGGNRLTTKRVKKMLEIKDLVKDLIQNHIKKING